MNKDYLHQHLKKFNVRSTPIRLMILDYFFTENKAVSSSDIEQALNKDLDRITLYRTLKTFIEHGIIHRIDVEQQSYYAMCSDCAIHQHQDNHVHFKCTQCETVECITENGSIDFSVPKEYQVERMNILLEGICKSCS